jgi:hypothetical protein
VRAITLTQPWASLVAVGAKRIETRSWRTNYRGRIAIHAAREPAAFEHYSVIALIGAKRDWPLGAVVAFGEITDCIRTEDIGGAELNYIRQQPGVTWTERLFGDYTPGRFGFRIGATERLETPIPACGRLGIWEWDPAMEAGF